MKNEKRKAKNIYQNTVRNYGLNIQIQSYFFILSKL